MLDDKITNLNMTLNKQIYDPRASRQGSTFTREMRFSKDERFYCKYNGQSISVGPGTYEPKVIKHPCKTLIRESRYLSKEEAKK